MCGPLEWLNKITIVITKPILFDCQSGYGIFTFCGPIKAEFKSRAASDIKVFSSVDGMVGCPCLMSEKQKGISVHSSKRRIREMNVSVSLQ